MPRAKGPAVPPSAHLPPGVLSPMMVAMHFKCRYQRARDLMLAGRLGEPVYHGRTLTVKLEDVEKFARTLATPVTTTTGKKRGASR
jgi:hypothetical protein